MAGRKSEPVRLDTGELDGSDRTVLLTRAVCAGFYDRPGHSYPEPPLGFDALALILEARIQAEKVSERRKLAYPMAKNGGVNE